MLLYCSELIALSIIRNFLSMWPLYLFITEKINDHINLYEQFVFEIRIYFMYMHHVKNVGLMMSHCSASCKHINGQ